MDPINDINQKTEDPLSAIAPLQQAQTMDDEQANRRASLYGFTKYLDNPVPDGDLADSYLTQSTIAKDIIHKFGDRQLRYDAEVEGLSKTMQNLSTLEVEIPGGVASSQKVANQVFMERAAQKKSEAAEKAWAESVALLRDRGQEDMADLSIIDHKTPDLYQSMVDRQADRALLMKAIEDAQIDAEQRGWFFNLVDTLMYMVPFSNSFANTDNFETTTTQWYDNILSGERKQSEAVSWWRAMENATGDEKQDIMDRFVEGARKNTSWLFGQNKLMMLNNLSSLTGYVDPTMTNVFDGLDNVPLLGTVAYKAFKLPFRVTNTLKGFGANKEVANIIEKAAKSIEAEGAQAVAQKMGVTLDEVEENLAASAFNPKQQRKTTWYNGDLVDNETGLVVKENVPKEAVEEVTDDIGGDLANQALFDGLDSWNDYIKDVVTIERLTPEEQVDALAYMNKQAQSLRTNSKDKRYLHTDAKMTEHTFETGQKVWGYEATLGRVPKSQDMSPWFKRESDANTFKAKTGISDAVVVKMEGGYGVKIRLPFDETALGSARIYAAMSTVEKTGAFASIARFTAGGKLLADKELFGLAALSTDKINRIMTQLNRNVLPKFYAINKAEKDVLGAVLTNGERASKWYTDNEIKVFYGANFGNKANPEKFVEAYNAARELNDLEFRVRNIQELINLKTQGYEGVRLPWFSTHQNGKILRNYNSVPNEAVFIVSKDGAGGQFAVDTLEQGVKKGKTTYEPRLTLNQMKDYQEGTDTIEQHFVVRMQKPQKVMVGKQEAYARYFLVPSKQLDTAELSPLQIPYKAGGHRMYAGKYFVKKATTGKQPWGETYLKSPFTPTVANTKADALVWAKEANAIQDSYKAAKDAGLGGDELLQAVQDKIDGSSKGFPDADEFVAWMDEHGADHPFEAVFDRELPSYYSGPGKMSGSDMEELSGVNTFLETQGRMFTSGKGDILQNLNDWDGPAETLDPFTTLNNSLTNIARMTSLFDFKTRGVQKWISTFGHALDLRGLENMHPMRIFLESKFRTGTPELQKIKAAAENQRSYIKRIVGWKSDFDLGVEAATRQLVEMAAGTTPGKRAEWVTNTANWVNEKKPINAAMGIAFDMTMGLFNLAQAPLQIQTAFAAAAIDTVKGGQAMANMASVFHYMRKAASEADLDFWVSRGAHKLAGFAKDPDGYKTMMRELRKSGFMDNMMSVMKNELGPNTAASMIGRGIHNTRAAGRVVVDKAEEFNRGVAWQMAWRRTAENPAYVNLKPGTPMFIEKVRSLASTFAGNMDQAGAAWWQKNPVTRLPTQFMSYMARWHEMLGNADLTATDKFRFFLGQFVMYGTAGIPGVAVGMEMYNNSQGTAPDIKTPQGMVARGFWDSLIYLSTGADAAFSERAGIGAMPTDLIGEIFGMSQYGNVSTADMLGGATWQILGDARGALWETLKYSMAESGGKGVKPIQEHNLKTLARYISSLNNVLKAEAVWKYGEYTNRKGEVIANDLPSMYGFAALLGIPPGEFQKLSAEVAWNKDRKAKVDAWTEQVMIHRQQFANAVRDGDYNKAEEIRESINFIMSELVDRNLRKDVLQQVQRNPNMTNVLDAIGDRVQKEKTLDQFANENEE